MSDGQAVFATTLWSEVLHAGKDGTSRSEAALESLCSKYWPPLYLFVRKSGFDVQEAQDITQAFFLRIVEKKFHLEAEPELGRFRTFLLAAMKNFLANWRRGAARQKRGGGSVTLSLNLEDAEQGIALELSSSESPERLYYRSWANRLLEVVVGRLEREYRDAGEAERFQALRFCLDDPESMPAYAELAARLELSESGIKSAVARMRRQFRRYYRDEVAQIVGDPASVDEEIRSLLEAF